MLCSVFLRHCDVSFIISKLRYPYTFTKTRISNKAKYTSLFRMFWLGMKITSQLRCVMVCQFTVSFPTSELCYKCFSYNDIFLMTLGLGSFVVRLHYVWK